MPEFACRVGTPKGEIVLKTVYAKSLDQARKELEKQGYWVFEVRPARRWRDWVSALFIRRASRVAMHRFLIFNQEFITLLRAGLPILRCLEILESRQKDALLRFIIAGVRDRLRAGAALSEAFADFTEHIPSIYIAALVAGERSGQLDRVLRRFVEYQNLIYETRKRILSSLTYPVILLSLASILLGVLFSFVIPRFLDFYRSMNAQLPWITMFILDVAARIRRYGFWVVSGMVIGGYILWLVLHHLPDVRRRWHRFLLSLGIFGRVMWMYALGQFAHTLATLLSSGMPLVQAMEVAASSVWNQHVAHQILHARQLVREGMSTHEALESAGIREDLLLEMVQVGEQTGALDEMLEHAARFLDEDVTTIIHRLMALIEPAILVVMAIIVLFVLLSVYYPIFTLATSMQV